jgi:hypothetical protein
MLQAEEYPFVLHMLMKTSILPADLSYGLYEMKVSVKNKLEMLVRIMLLPLIFKVP